MADKLAAFMALHTGRYVYVETVGDIPEFYDLKKDPYQLQNAVDLQEYRTMVTKLAKRLRKERSLKDYQKAPKKLNEWGD